MKKGSKKVMSGIVAVCLCASLSSVSLAAGPEAQADAPKTLTVTYYEVDGEVVIDGATTFQIMPDGSLTDARGRAVSPRFQLIQRVSVGLTHEGSLTHSVAAITLFEEGDKAAGKLRLCKLSGDEWVTKKSKSYSTSSAADIPYYLDFDYYVSRGDWRAELDITTTSASGVPGESITVASDVLHY